MITMNKSILYQARETLNGEKQVTKQKDNVYINRKSFRALISNVTFGAFFCFEAENPEIESKNTGGLGVCRI